MEDVLENSVEGRIYIRNPWSEAIVGWVPSMSAEQLRPILDEICAKRPAIPAEERERILLDAAIALRAEKESLAQLIVSESGNCLRDACKEVERAIRNLSYASAEAVRVAGETIQFVSNGKPRTALTQWHPIGPVFGITPFNRPLNQVVVKVAPAIASGNPIIIKPSEKTPLSCLAFRDILLRVGLPKNRFAVVTGDPAVIARTVLSDPRIRMLTFTGGVESGRRVATLAGSRKVVLELGGNDPFIVLDDADIEAAAAIACDGALATAGQSCRGIKRILATPGIADSLVERIRVLAAAKNWGDPNNERTEVGSLINSQAANVVQRRTALAIEDGAVLISGGGRLRSVLQPILLDHVKPTSELVQLETFGPVIPVIRCEGLDEIISVANGTPYGLQAGVATQDLSSFFRLASELEVGGVAWMDGPNFESPALPFGGIKESGLGREGMKYSIREMSTIKTVVVPSVSL